MYTPTKNINNNPQNLSNSRNHHLKCVCEICTCGKHTCPQKSAKFQGQTTNNYYYKPYDITTDKIQKIDYLPRQEHYDPNLIKSTYGATYTPHKIEKDRTMNDRYQYQPTRGKFEDQTEYRKNYIPSQIQADRPFAPMQYVQNNTKFEGTTTYNRQYSPKRGETSNSTATYNYQPNKIPFQGQTTYEQEYKPHQIEAHKPQISNQYIPHNSRFTGQSHYKEQYQAYNIQPQHRCPTEGMPPMPRRCSPGKEHLHYNGQRNNWQ